MVIGDEWLMVMCVECWDVIDYWWIIDGTGLWLVKIDERRLAVDDCLWYSIGNGYSIISVEWREIGAG